MLPLIAPAEPRAGPPASAAMSGPAAITRPIPRTSTGPSAVTRPVSVPISAPVPVAVGDVLAVRLVGVGVALDDLRVLARLVSRRQADLMAARARVDQRLQGVSCRLKVLVNCRNQPGHPLPPSPLSLNTGGGCRPHSA